jgi:phosphatidylglycerol lysyltransferase
MDPQVLVALAVDADRTVHGVTSWMPIHAPGGTLTGYTLDVMRRLPDGYRYTMELLIATVCQTMKERGLQQISLSGAPLAHGGSADSEADRHLLDQFLQRLGDTLEPYYGFQSLNAFKRKFQPRHRSLYLVVPDEAALPRVGVAIGRAYLPDAGLTDLVGPMLAARSESSG